jgi:hypothetical protein
VRRLVLVVVLVMAGAGCGGRGPGAPAARAADGWLAWTDPAAVSVRAPGGRIERYPATRPAGLRWSPGGAFLAWVTATGVTRLDLASGRETTWAGPFSGAGFTSAGLLALGPDRVHVLTPGQPPAPHPVDLPADAEPGPLGSVADGLLVAAASAPAASGGPQSVFLVAADGTTRRLLDGDAGPQGEVINVPVSVPAARDGTLAYATGGRSGRCGASYRVHLLDTGTGRDTPVAMPDPEGPDRAWAVRSLAWGGDGMLTAVLASIPAGGVCASEPVSPSVWRLERTRWVRQDRQGLLAAPGPGGRLALVAGRVTDQGEVLGNRELVLIGPDGTRQPLGRGVLELLWAPA